MIDIHKATEIVLEHARSFGTELVPLEKSSGRVLMEDLQADRDFPPYDRVTMDGIAIQHQAFLNGIRNFNVEGIQAAGDPEKVLSDDENCLEVMTGSVLPGKTDTVIRYEDLELANGHAKITVDSIRPEQNVHKQGTDRSAGETIVKAPCLITPAEIGVASTIGKTMLEVAKLPKVAVISTGDELVDVEITPAAHQIRKSNIYTIAASLEEWQIPVECFHLDDDEQQIKESLTEIFSEHQVVILSGGVSKGKFDFIPGVLEQLGVTKHFHKVKQRPGKPFWFGTSPEGITVFALPGNPVSSFMCTKRYIIPWLKKCMSIAPLDLPNAILTENYSFKPELQYFLQVAISYDKAGRLLATPCVGHGSGDLANLCDADGFLELPAGKEEFLEGESFPYYQYRRK